MVLDKILEDPPKIHYDSVGNLVSYSLAIDSLNFINIYVDEIHSTLETGAGISTILFAGKSSKHTCIVPSRQQVENIKKYCSNQNIDYSNITFIINRSEDELPNLEIEGLDFVLIDGRHAFPSPFIDWYYISPRLRIDGLLMIDDTQLWTGQVLRDFLKEEPEWEQFKEFPRTSIFRKIKKVDHGRSWLYQPYVEKRSSLYASGWRHRKILSRIQYGLILFRTGEFRKFFTKLWGKFFDAAN